MTQCLFGHVELLEQQIDSYSHGIVGQASAEVRSDVEEMMSVYVSLVNELEKSVVRVSPRNSWNQDAVNQRLPMYRRLALLGAQLRDFAKRLKAAGCQPTGLDEFVQALILARAGMTADRDSVALAEAVAGKRSLRLLRGSAVRTSNI